MNSMTLRTSKDYAKNYEGNGQSLRMKLRSEQSLRALFCMSAANCTSRFRAWSNPTLPRMFDNPRSTFQSSIFRQAEVLRLPSGVHATSSVPDECVRGYVRPFCGGSPLAEHTFHCKTWPPSKSRPRRIRK